MSIATESPETPRIDEPLALSAPLAWRLAPQLCSKEPASGEDCSWYHGIWQYLRLMGLGGSPAIHADFYRRALAGVTGGSRPPRLLISGAADYAMLAHVLAAFRQRGSDPAITVVDLCETPLWLNRWYADRVSCRITTHRGDISEFDAPEPYDALCTHAFFGQVAHERRPALLAAWKRLLRPGGLAITADRIRHHATHAPVGFSAQQAQSFLASVERFAESAGKSLPFDPRDLVRAAELYARKQALYPVASLREIQGLFELAGFEVEQKICGPNETATGREDSGPAIPAHADYACIIARRR